MAKKCLDCGEPTFRGTHIRCQNCASIHRSKVSLKKWSEKKAAARGEGKPVKPVDPKWLVRGEPSRNSGASQISGAGW